MLGYVEYSISLETGLIATFSMKFHFASGLLTDCEGESPAIHLQGDRGMQLIYCRVH